MNKQYKEFFVMGCHATTLGKSKKRRDTVRTIMLAIFLCVGQGMWGQTISGPTTVNQSTQHTYQLNYSGSVSGTNWTKPLGSTIISSTDYSVTLRFDSAGTDWLRVSFQDGFNYLNTGLSITVNASPPAQPPTPTIAEFCGYTRLTRAAPPNDVDYYWQSSDTGTDETDSSNFVDRTSGTTYYLRAKNSAGWSPARTINYSLKTVPATPAAPWVESSSCGQVVLKRFLQDQNDGAGNIWYWQSGPDDTLTTSTSETITLSAGNIYYLRSYNTTSGCWSTASASVSYTIPAPPVWYLDGDNDGFYEAGATLTQCAHPGTGYYSQGILPGDCDDGDGTLNPNTLWFTDTDDDGFRDHNGYETRQQCVKPTGNWTTSTVSDFCPEHYYASNDGCDPNCTSLTLGTTLMEFGASGGSGNSIATAPVNCSNGYVVSVGTTPSWLQTSVNGNTITVTCSAGTEGREATVAVYINGSIAGTGILVKQNGGTGSGGGGNTCTANAISDITFGSVADSDVVNVTYTSGSTCNGTLYLQHPYNTIPDWLTITKNGTSFTLNVSDNDSGITRTTILIPVLDDGAGNTVGIGVNFKITQGSCLTAWYLDSDGDTFGDAFGDPILGCNDPDNDPNDDPNTSWVDNNDDRCPETSSTSNQGCPPGQTPENYNAVTTRSYDIDNTLKVAGKAYFDALGKPVQSQGWSIRTDDIWASETRYDPQGRAALQTLAAPITSGSTFSYKTGFIKRADNTSDYSVADYTGMQLESPNTVGNATGTLGWYYSDLNNREAYQDISAFPFTSKVYSTLNPGTPLRVLGGNKVDTNRDGTVDASDSWVQGYTFTMRASQELSRTVAFGTTDYDDDKILKTVSQDPHGVENVIFVDTDGKVLAAARSGAEGSTSNALTLPIREQGYVDVHIPVGLSGFTVSDPGAVTVYDLITEQVVAGGTGSLPNGFYRVAVNDPDTYVSGTITVIYTVNYYDYSLNEYDEADRLIASYQPLTNSSLEKLVTTYEYNTLGQLIKVNSPDEGIAEFIYRTDGQIRFSQNSEQAKVNEVSYTDYDHLGRPIEGGVLTGVDFSTLNETSGLGPNRKEEQYTTYDAIPTTVDLSLILPSGYQAPSFLSGNVAITSNDQNTTYYSYDVYGRVKWIAQNIVGLGIKTIDYAYHPVTGLVRDVIFQKDVAAEKFIHRYTYTSANELQLVETSLDGSTWVTQAQYSYYEAGGLKRTELAGGVQGIDYVYNLSGQLKGLNHPSLSPANDPGGDGNDLFGMQLDYYAGDYARNTGNMTHSPYGTSQLNGNIKSIRWNNSFPNTQESEYSYSYNRNNWLTEADFDPATPDPGGPGSDPTDNTVYGNGTVTLLEGTNSIGLLPGFHAQTGSTFTAKINASGGGGGGDYDVSNITYDANGNIQSLTRNKGSLDDGRAMDQLSYTYKGDKPNQLLQVQDAQGDVVGAEDIGDQTNAQNYIYNDIGQLTNNLSEEISYFYNTSGLVTEVRKNNVTLVKFFYNDRNHRVKKESYIGGSLASTAYYIRDVKGEIMSIYSDVAGNGVVLTEQPVYGGGRIGVAYNGSNNVRSYTYELTDHLGNVRAVFTKNGSSAQGEGYTDYYPFGMAMPGRNLTDANQYRYAFQGQEKDPETGKEAFELRLWDSRIGRWLSPDPYGQYFSPYLGMGNNPINGIDPDGGCFTTDKSGNRIPCPTMDVGSTITGMAGYEWTMQDDGWARSDGYGVTVSPNYADKLRFAFYMMDKRLKADGPRTGLTIWGSNGNGDFDIGVNFDESFWTINAPDIYTFGNGPRLTKNFTFILDNNLASEVDNSDFVDETSTSLEIDNRIKVAIIEYELPFDYRDIALKENKKDTLVDFDTGIQIYLDNSERYLKAHKGLDSLKFIRYERLRAQFPSSTFPPNPYPDPFKN